MHINKMHQPLRGKGGLACQPFCCILTAWGSSQVIFVAAVLIAATSMDWKDQAWLRRIKHGLEGLRRKVHGGEVKK
jgi:hypothetical protein